MTGIRCLPLAFVLCCLTSPPAPAQEVARVQDIASSRDRVETHRWDEAIGKFEEEDRARTPAKEGLLFIGSSTIRLWKTSEAFADWKPLNRGFGGSRIADVNQYFDRIVAPYVPRVIVFYSGDNDIAGGLSAEQVAHDFSAFLDRVQAMSASTRVVFLSIKPSVKRWDKWETMRDANGRIRKMLENRGIGTYVDMSASMLGGDGKPRADLFVADGLHLNADGYSLWNSRLTPVLAREMKSP